MLETTSFDDIQIAMYRGLRAMKTDPDPKTVCYSLQKQPEMLETMNFHGVKIAVNQGSLHIVQIAVYRGSRDMKTVPGPQNSVLYPTKTTRNARKDEF